jgi:hypothetical protein
MRHYVGRWFSRGMRMPLIMTNRRVKKLIERAIPV